MATRSNNTRSATEVQADITCPDFEPDGLSCAHYLCGHGCVIATNRLVAVHGRAMLGEPVYCEWREENLHLLIRDACGEDVPREPVVAGSQYSLRKALASEPFDLFGNPNPDYRPAPPKGTASVPSTRAPSRQPSPREVEGTRSVPSPAEPTDTSQPSPQRGLTTADIESFKALGVEVCIESEAAGQIWLVPAYTGADRKEISVEHAGTLATICSVFPGARVVSFEKLPDSAATPPDGTGAPARRPAR